MEFGLAVFGNIEQEKTKLIVDLSDKMQNYFQSKCYGKDIKSLTIGIVCVSPEFEQLFKGKKPKYTKGKKTINPDGIPFLLEDSFEFNIKIDYKTFKDASDVIARKILASEILKSISILQEFKTKIKDFNAERFEEDLEQYF